MRTEINELGWAVLGHDKQLEVLSGKARLGTTRATWVGGGWEKDGSCRRDAKEKGQ